MTPVRPPSGVTAAAGGQDRCGSPDEEDLTMLLVLLRTRLKALVFTWSTISTVSRSSIASSATGHGSSQRRSRPSR